MGDGARVLAVNYGADWDEKFRRKQSHYMLKKLGPEWFHAKNPAIVEYVSTGQSARWNWRQVLCVDLNTRYFGPGFNSMPPYTSKWGGGYYRGHWPIIRDTILWFKLSGFKLVVWYGSDEIYWPIIVTKQLINVLDKEFYSPKNAQENIDVFLEHFEHQTGYCEFCGINAVLRGDDGRRSTRDSGGVCEVCGGPVSAPREKKRS